MWKSLPTVEQCINPHTHELMFDTHTDAVTHMFADIPHRLCAIAIQ